MKNMAVGGLCVAAEHGNFLLNRGQASFADLQLLEKQIRSAVAARTGVDPGKGSDLRVGGRKQILSRRCSPAGGVLPEAGKFT